MDIIEAILTRRSIRKFNGEPVSDSQLQTVLEAAFAAPSAHNYQPWHFLVVRSKDVLERIAAGHPYAKMLPEAGCGIIVCGDKERQGMTGFLIEDCSAAIENMLLAAHGLGLGAVWCGLYPVTKLTKHISGLFSLPPTVIPVGLVVVGAGSESKPAAQRYDPAKIHYDRW